MKKKKDLVNVIVDFDTNKIVKMPAAELAPGMIQCIHPAFGPVWADAEKLTMHQSDTPLRHTSLSEELRDRIKNVRTILSEVDRETDQEWEAQFQMDAYPEREIRIWERIAATYEQTVRGRYLTVGQKEEIFSVALVCSSTNPANVLEVVALDQITRAEAVQVILAYYDRKL